MSVLSCGYSYCSGPRIHQRSPLWDEEGEDLEIPVDAAPWLLRTCENRGIPPGCAFIVDGVEVRVLPEVYGAEACSLDAEETIAAEGGPAVIQHLRPREPFPPGAVVTLDCAGDDDYYGYYDWGEPELYFDYSYDWSFSGLSSSPQLRIRASDEPAAPPGEITVLELHYTRGDPYDSCIGDTLEVKIDFGAQFLKEGGYVEVKYPNGEVFQFSRPNEDGVAVLPATRGALQFTPVAVDGERGETVEVGPEQFTGDIVYIPSCAMSPEQDLGGVAGLLALTVLAVARRRRTDEAAP